jgi:heme exporter protein D
MHDFLAMDGYAGFVWPAYGLTFLVMAALAVASRRALLRREAELALLQARVRASRS